MSVSVSEYFFLCEVCGKKYHYRKSLNRHMAQDHSLHMPPRVKKKYSRFRCQFCAKHFLTSSNFNRHKRRVHGDWSGVQDKFSCKLCAFKANSKRSWLDHIQTSHKIPIRTEDLQFSTYDEFLKWKAEIEKCTNSKYIMKYGSTAINHKKVRKYYICRRSGYFVSKSEGKRRLKAAGSVKMNGRCPAEMKVVVGKDGSYTVRFVSTHICHKLTPDNPQPIHTAVPDQVTIGVEGQSMDNEVEISLDEGKGNLCRNEFLSNHTQLQVTTVPDPVDSSFEDPPIVNEIQVVLDKLKGREWSKDPSTMSDEKKMLISMFSNIICSMASSEVHLANEMLVSLRDSLSVLRFEDSAVLRSGVTPKRTTSQGRLFSPGEKGASTHCPLTEPSGLETNETQCLSNVKELDANLSLVVEHCDVILWVPQSQKAAPELYKENPVSLEHCYALPYQLQQNCSSHG